MSYFLLLWWWISLNFQVGFRVWAPHPRILPSLPGRVWANGCVSMWRWTDRQALPGCFTWNRAQKVPELPSLSGREIPGEWAASAKIKGAFTDSQLPNTCCSSWTDSSGTVLHDIYHKLTAMKLAISVVTFLYKNKNTSLAWVIFIAHSQLKTSFPLPWLHKTSVTCGDTRT